MTLPWKDGYYRFKDTTLWTFVVKGEDLTMCNTGCVDLQIENPRDMIKGTLKFGSYGEALPSIEKITGKKNYDVEMSYPGQMIHSLGCITDDGKRIIMPAMMNPSIELDELYLMSKEEFEELLNAGDPVEAMKCPYKIEPENPGKFLWISGPPGAGKSTSAQLLSKNDGFVYYEADCVMNHANPYIPSDVESPSMAQMLQNHLKGVTKEMEDGVQAGNEFFLKLSESQEVDDLAGEKFYKYMSQCVGSERKRIGGNWAVAQAVPTKNLRDAIRKTLGNDKVTFILLNLEKETARERLAQRHGDTETGIAETEFLLKIQEFYEPKGDDEESTFDVTITNEMDQNDVVKKILEII